MDNYQEGISISIEIDDGNKNNNIASDFNEGATIIKLSLLPCYAMIIAMVSAASLVITKLIEITDCYTPTTSYIGSTDPSDWLETFGIGGIIISMITVIIQGISRWPSFNEKIVFVPIIIGGILFIFWGIIGSLVFFTKLSGCVFKEGDGIAIMILIDTVVFLLSGLYLVLFIVCGDGFIYMKKIIDQ